MLSSSSSEITLHAVSPATPNIVAQQTHKSQRRSAPLNLRPLQKTGSHPDLMKVVFDSLRSRRCQGRRNGLYVSRQIIYRLGKVVVEMRLEPALDSHHMNITGQISLGKDLWEADGIVVAITSPLAKLAETRTNRFGEFQLDYVPEKTQSVTFEPVKGRSLRIPLDSGGVWNQEPKK